MTSKTVGPRPGDILRGKYRVVRVLGEGGMGVVVRATHLRLERDVAIKMLRADASDSPRLVARFAREARAAARLRGEHAVKILDVDDDGDEGAPFLVMEYLEGKDLDRLVRREGPLATKRAVRYALEACEGLAEAHALGIVHRDVKPANLFLATTARGGEIVKILDFGISKPASGDDPTLTEGDRILGSPSFMSPEQLKAARDVDVRTDIWSLGIVLYWLTTGELPFAGETATAVAANIASEEPPRLSSPLAGVVARCLSKDREKRFSSVAELAHALAPFAPASEGEEAARRVSSVLRLPVAAPASSHASAAMPAAGPTASISSPAARVTASLDDRVTASIDAPAPITSTSPGEAKVHTVPPPPARTRWPIAIAVAAIAAVVAFVVTRPRERPPAPAPHTEATPPPSVSIAPPSSAPEPDAPASASPSASPSASVPTPVVAKSSAKPPRAKDAAVPRASDDPLKLEIK